MYVEKLTMKDFRCFEQAEVTFVYPGKEGLPEEALNNVTLLIGINGTGKTTTLRGVALTALARIILYLGYSPYALIRRNKANLPGPAAADLNAVFGHGGEKYTRTVSIKLTTDGELFDLPGREGKGNRPIGSEIDEPFRTMTLLGYGATRRTEYAENLDSQSAKRRNRRFKPVAGLFEDYITLYPLVAWYPHPEMEHRREEVRDLLNSLLPEGTEFTGEFKDADAVFKHNGVELPFGALSDGFRSYIGLVADMLYHLNYVCPKKSKLTDLSGVVMIDDIDVHLHPKWQREVVPKLAGTFPKLQFIITSHSPLVAGTLHAANIRVVEDNQIHEYTERIHGLSADQILLSSYFGHIPPRSPDAVNKLNRIADRVADEGDPTAAIDFLKELAGKTNGKPAASQKPGKKKK